jgi:hypothetical protein
MSTRVDSRFPHWYQQVTRALRDVVLPGKVGVDVSKHPKGRTPVDYALRVNNQVIVFKASVINQGVFLFSGTTIAEWNL